MMWGLGLGESTKWIARGRYRLRRVKESFTCALNIEEEGGEVRGEGVRWRLDERSCGRQSPKPGSHSHACRPATSKDGVHGRKRDPGAGIMTLLPHPSLPQLWPPGLK